MYSLRSHNVVSTQNVVLQATEILDFSSQESSLLSEDSQGVFRAKSTRKRKNEITINTTSPDRRRTRRSVNQEQISLSTALRSVIVKNEIEEPQIVTPVTNYSQWKVDHVEAPPRCSLFSSVVLRWNLQYLGVLSNTSGPLQLTRVSPPIVTDYPRNGIWLETNSSKDSNTETFLLIQLYERSTLSPLTNNKEDSIVQFCSKCGTKRQEVIKLGQEKLTCNSEGTFEAPIAVNEQCAHRSENSYGPPSTRFYFKLQVFERSIHHHNNTTTTITTSSMIGGDNNNNNTTSLQLRSKPAMSDTIKVVAPGKNKPSPSQQQQQQSSVHNNNTTSTIIPPLNNNNNTIISPNNNTTLPANNNNNNNNNNVLRIPQIKIEPDTIGSSSSASSNGNTMNPPSIQYNYLHRKGDKMTLKQCIEMMVAYQKGSEMAMMATIQQLQKQVNTLQDDLEHYKVRTELLEHQLMMQQSHTHTNGSASSLIPDVDHHLPDVVAGLDVAAAADGQHIDINMFETNSINHEGDPFIMAPELMARSPLSEDTPIPFSENSLDGFLNMLQQSSSF